MIKEVIHALQLKGHAVFENDSKPFNLNYVGIRDISKVGTFNDWLFLFWKYKGVWNSVCRLGTTDPGLYYLEHPLSSKGCAILKEGQMRGAWKTGYHLQSKYGKDHPGLVQRKDVTVIRDPNRDNVLDIVGGVEETGMFGINPHRSLTKGEVAKIGKFSAGCQVTLNPNEHDVFMAICYESAEVWGNAFTYTLINVNDLK